MNLLSKLFQQQPQTTVAQERSRAGDVLLSEFFDKRFYPHLEVTRRRPRLVQQIFNRHIRKSLGHLQLNELDNEVLDNWVRLHIKRRYKPGTINKHIFLVNQLLNVARHWGLIDHNSFQNRTIKRLPTGDYKQRFLTEAEVRRMLDACARDQHPFLYFFAKLLILTGARSGEARLAKWRDFDVQQRIWTVPVSKNGRSRRIVISTAVIELLKDIRAQADRLYLPYKQSDYCFINPKSKRPYDSFHCAWDRTRIIAELPELRIHDMRHTYASLLINKGASIYEVQTLLGHHHISMTARYAHLLPSTLQSRVEIVSDMFE